ncbi:MAG: DUF3592 domain-containing protein, partial [Anaerolineae bacterium]|nr:DUF3592 domain-containing protein [Anaerolineae bacterium]
MNKSKSCAPAGCFLTVFSLLFLIIGVAEGMVVQGIELYQLKQSGVTTSGVIIAQRVEESASGKISYHIVYRFNAETDGSIQQITHEERVSEDIYESLHQNDSISVVYLPDDPDVRTIQDVNSSLKSVVTWAAAMLGCLYLGSLSMLQHGLGLSITYFGTSLIVMGIMTFVGSFFGHGANTGRSRA